MIQENALLSGQAAYYSQQLFFQGDRNKSFEQIKIKEQQSQSIGEAALSIQGGSTSGNAASSGQLANKKIFQLILPEVFKESFEKEGENRWRQQNADITDYFNYGFCEVTFQAYANKVRTWRGKFPLSEDYKANKHGLVKLNDNVPLEYGGCCSPFDEELLETPQSFNIFEKGQFIDVALDQYVESFSQIMSKYMGSQRSDFVDFMQTRNILSQYVEKQTKEMTDSDDNANEVGGHRNFFQNNLSQYSVSANYAEYNREKKKNIDFIALHAQVIHNITQKNDTIHSNDAEKVYFLHDIFKNEISLPFGINNTDKPTGSLITSIEASKLLNNIPQKLPVMPPVMQRSMMPFQQPMVQTFPQQYFGQLLKQQMMTIGGQGYFSMARNPYFMGGLQGMRGGMPQMGMTGFTGNMKQQQQMMNMQNQFYQMEQECDFGGGYEQREDGSNNGIYLSDRNEGYRNNRGGSYQIYKKDHSQYDHGDSSKPSFNKFNEETEYISSYKTSNKDKKSRNEGNRLQDSDSRNEFKQKRRHEKQSQTRSRSRSRHDRKDHQKDKNDEGNRHKTESRRKKNEEDNRISNEGREYDEKKEKKNYEKERKRSSEKKRDKKEDIIEQRNSSKSKKRDSSKSKKRDSSKSKKNEKSKSKKNEQINSKRSQSAEIKFKKDKSQEKIPSRVQNPDNNKLEQNQQINSSNQSILDRIQKKSKPLIEITKSRERSRSKDKRRQNNEKKKNYINKQDSVNSLSSEVSLPRESREKKTKSYGSEDHQSNDKKTIQIINKNKENQLNIIETPSSSSSNVIQIKRQLGKEDNPDDKKHATHPNFFSNFFSALKKNTNDKFEENKSHQSSKSIKNRSKFHRSDSSQSSRSSSQRKKKQYSQNNSQHYAKR